MLIPNAGKANGVKRVTGRLYYITPAVRSQNMPAVIVNSDPSVVSNTIFAASAPSFPMDSAIIYEPTAVGEANITNRITIRSPVNPAAIAIGTKIKGFNMSFIAAAMAAGLNLFRIWPVLIDAPIASNARGVAKLAIEFSPLCINAGI